METTPLHCTATHSSGLDLPIPNSIQDHPKVCHSLLLPLTYKGVSSISSWALEFCVYRTHSLCFLTSISSHQHPFYTMIGKPSLDVSATAY